VLRRSGEDRRLGTPRRRCAPRRRGAARQRVRLGSGVRLADGMVLARTPLQIQCHPYLVYPNSYTEIGVGCVVHPVEYWLGAEEPKELAFHPECRPWAAYRLALELVAAHMPAGKEE